MPVLGHFDEAMRVCEEAYLVPVKGEGHADDDRQSWVACSVLFSFTLELRSASRYPIECRFVIHSTTD